MIYGRKVGFLDGAAVGILLGTNVSGYAGFNEFLNLTVHGAGEINGHNDSNSGLYYALYIGSQDNLFNGLDMYDCRVYGAQFYSAHSVDPARNVLINSRLHDIVLTDSTNRISGILVAGSDCQVINTTFYNIGTSSHHADGAVFNYAGSGSVFYYNTITNNTGAGLVLAGSSSNATVRDNIMYANSDGNYNNSAPGTVEDHNLRDGTNPLFVNSGAADFSLMAISPAIGAAINVGITSDAAGNARPQSGNYDAGALQYVSGSLPAFTLVDTQSGGSTASGSTIVTPSITTHSGGLIVAKFRHDAGVTVTGISDTVGNTYTLATSGTDIYGAKLYEYYAYNCPASGSNVITVTLSGSVVYRVYQVDSWDGVKATSNPLLDASFATNSGTVISTATLNISSSANALVSGLVLGTGLNITASGGYVVNRFSITGDANQYFAQEYGNIQSNQAMTSTQNSGGWAVVGAAFAPAPVAPGVDGTGQIGANAPSFNGSGSVSFNSGGVTAPAPSFNGVGTITFTGSGGIAAVAPSFSASGTLVVAGTGDFTAPAVSFNSGLQVDGVGDFTSYAPTFSSEGNTLVNGVGDFTAPPVSFDSGIQIGGVGDFTAPAVSFQGNSVQIDGSGGITVLKPSFNGHGQVRRHGRRLALDCDPYTLQDIRSMLQDKIEDVPFWTDTEADAAINESLLMWNSLTGYWKGEQTIPTTSNNWDYALDSSLVFGMRVEYNGKPLALSSRADMDWGHPGWQGQNTSSGGNVPTEPKNWLPLSLELIAIWPADHVGGNTLRVFGISQTPELVDDLDILDIGDEELDALLGYCLHTLALKEGGARFASTSDYFTQFLQEAAEENDQLLDSAIFREFIGTDQGRNMIITRGRPNPYDKLGGREP